MRRVLILLLALSAAACATPRRLRPFTTDGCSAFPDQGLGQRQDWYDCCVAHDMAYWRGGSAEDRAAADLALRRCVEERTGSGTLAEAMYLGVRAGGSALYPTSFRWGYGWRFDHPNQPLDPVERRIADQEIDRWLETHPAAPTPPWRLPPPPATPPAPAPPGASRGGPPAAASATASATASSSGPRTASSRTAR